MTNEGTLSKDRRTLTVRINSTIKKRGGRKLVIAPDGAPWSPPCSRIDSTMIKAIARAHRWKRLLEGGLYASVAELAAAEKIKATKTLEIVRPSEEENARWKAQTAQAVWDKWVADMKAKGLDGKPVLDEFISLVRKYEPKSGYTPGFDVLQQGK